MKIHKVLVEEAKDPFVLSQLSSTTLDKGRVDPDSVRPLGLEETRVELGTFGGWSGGLSLLHPPCGYLFSLLSTTVISVST